MDMATFSERVEPVRPAARQALADRLAIERAIAHDGEQAVAIHVRKPLSDRFTPRVYDVDLMMFAPLPAFRPERRHAAGPHDRALDIVWYPQSLLQQPEALAQLGLAAHRYMASEAVHDPQGLSATCSAAMQACFHRADIRSARWNVFLDVGWKTVREIGISWDFPELARFWLHMATASCVAFGLDGLGGFCPNVFTRPLLHLDEIEARTGLSLRAEVIDTLGLGQAPVPAIEALRRIHHVVSRRFAEPSWPDAMRGLTRAEYAYTIADDELAFRIAVARDMLAHGQPESALHYLRFWAYSLARIPMIHARAAEGVDAAFLQPETAVLPDLLAHCPEIVDDLRLVLAGGERVDAPQVQRGIASVVRLRDTLAGELRRRGLALDPLPEWAPFRPLQRRRDREPT